MRLINTKTYELREFNSGVPPYAILSHRWEEKEVTFADLSKRIPEDEREVWAPDDPDKLISWMKIKRACKTAREDNRVFEWIWLDMCCINKDSSAELQESLNSMFAWYRNADICLVYLRRIPDCTIEDASRDGSEFRASEWFTRGWTLQELIAPNDTMLFLSRNWRPIGTRGKLANIISEITNIDVELLSRPSPPLLTGQRAEALDFSKWSIATRMSWAANRQTTRAEDRAYSLSGLFDVTMPVMYGEGGENAFRRLQLEIIQNSPDQSILAWGSRIRLRPLPSESQWGPASPLGGYNVEEYSHARNLLASRPSDFLESSDIQTDSVDPLWQALRLEVPTERHFYRTNHGIRIPLPLLPTARSEVFFAALACREDSCGFLWIAIALKKVNGSDHTYMRCGHADFSHEETKIVDVGGIRDSDIRPRWEASTIYIQWQPVLHSPSLYPREFSILENVAHLS